MGYRAWFFSKYLRERVSALVVAKKVVVAAAQGL
jgi:hypothetical protein